MKQLLEKVTGYMDVITLIVSSVIAFLLAKYFGDVAGTKAAIEFEKQKSAEACIAALQSLLNEVVRIRKLASHNSELSPHSSSKPAVRMPTTAFETAFVSGNSSLSASRELLDAVTDYLTAADKINTLVDITVSGVPSGERAAQARMTTAKQQIDSLCTDNLPDILDRIDEAIRREMEEARY